MGDSGRMNQALKQAVTTGGYAVDPYAVAMAMLDRGRAPIPLGLRMLVTTEIVDGPPTGAGQDQPAALEGTA